ncbi:MFS transporter [Sphingomonas sp. MMSM20]|uniref:MFS transporter n=1 Tax=Sphingomonas lycopersici TaxID=2951807 RepID=UPI002238B8F5|nr:MFS transporter [Sphingomonas lycopersici]MCW6529060.1 MFS transporter [Sphingomonas lycopersici]
MTPKHRAIAPAGVGAYAMGSLANGVFSTVPTILLLYFCTEILRMPAAWAGLAVFIPKAWAVVWDPFVGTWSDRTRSRFGRRRPFMMIGAIGVPIAFAALFWAPVTGATARFAWVAVSYFALAGFYSLFAVPYSAVPAEISANPEVRARLVGWRMTASMIGVLVGAAVAPVLVEHFGGGRVGYAAMGGCIAAGCFVAMIPPIAMLADHDAAARPSAAGERRPRLIDQLRLAFADPGFRWLAITFLLQLTAVGAVSATVPYLVVGTWGRAEGEVGAAMGALLVATILSAPVWSWLGRRRGDRAMLMLAAVGYAGAAIALGLAALLHSSWPTAVICFAVAGIPFAGIQVLPFTIAAHTAHAQSAIRHAEGSAGVEGAFTGVWTSIEKLGLALGPAFAALVLSATGRGAAAIAGFVAVVPPALALLSIGVLSIRDRAGTRLEPAI